MVPDNRSRRARAPFAVKRVRPNLAVRLAQAALLAVLAAASGLSTAQLPAGALQDSLLAALRGPAGPPDNSSFHNPQRPELRLGHARSTAVQPFAAGLPAGWSGVTPLPVLSGAGARGPLGSVSAGLYDTCPARAPPSLLS